MDQELYIHMARFMTGMTYFSPSFVILKVDELICVEKFEDFPQLGRFTLRDEGMLFTSSAFLCTLSTAK